MPDLDLIANIHMLNDALNQKLNSNFRNPNINATNYFYLLKVQDNPGISQKDFKRIIFVHQTTITRAINHFEKLGYVITHQDPDDKRTFHLSLTDSGEKVANQIREDLLHTQNILNSSTIKIEMMMDVLRKLREDKD